MVDERTSLFAETRAGPSYVFPGRQPRTQAHQVKQFQCFICTSFICALMMALIIAISYSLTDDSNIDVNTASVAEKPKSTNDDGSVNVAINSKEKALNSTEIFTILLNMNWPLNDESPMKWQLPELSPQEKENAMNAGIKALGDRELLEENVASPEINSPSYRHQRALGTTLEARVLAKRGFVENYMTKVIAEKYAVRKPLSRWNIGQGVLIELDTPNMAAKCDFNSKYRNTNGTCNNKEFPLTYGVAMQPFRRALQPDYADGISAPRRTHGNESLPSARKVSTQVHRPSYSSDPNFTVMLAVFGQFLDHDITATALNQGQGGEPIECCDQSRAAHPECFPVEIGPNDPNFLKYNITCMNFVRSAPAPTGYFGPRQQLNQATAFIDGSVVYGAADKRLQALRTKENGLLRMFVTQDNRTLLPVSTDPEDGCNEVEMNSKGKYCFESGDTRANENLHLTSMHLIWARHHNYLASNLRSLNPQWSDDIIFQESRRILGAQLQHITYNEFLPVVLGREFSKKVGILPDEETRTDQYDANVDPSIANVFAAGAFRFAHTLLPSMMRWTSETSTEYIDLHKMLFNPYLLWGSNGLDSAIGSAIQTNLAKYDQYFTTELTERLFENRNANSSDPVKRSVNLDLVSLNIQRGRDHGLPAYNEWRKFCKLPSVDTWDTMKNAVDAASLANMKSIYKGAIDVDLYTGALSESPMEGAIVGPLLSCLLTDQFLRIKRGDSHWYERPVGPQRFSIDQLKQIYNTTLASIICRNSDAVEASQPFVMQQIRSGNEVTDCQLLDTFDFSPWVYDPLSKSIGNFVRVGNDQIKAINIITNRLK
ncbi:Peroxidasin [Pseudolycoriella hygida]|uniref:Peroxidasin n=1 Tax=Pseudolycoriella hygida TaxID=35572 RepID=A0A9Q0MS55_9DIPT|nr:Peroxidasin [Pseudolycoriella hygida]